MINKKKNHSHKNINFEIINSTSVSDNSFFPPLRKVQSCIVLKAICESQRRVGRRKGSRGRELSHCDLQTTELGSKAEKPTRKLHVRAFPRHLEGRVGVGLKSQSAGTRWCWQLLELLRARICRLDLANTCFEGF